jgi:Asp-tRNA(Asn)/Glu-tRNA(Gln) amidotransferase A subunit family amidase
MRKQSRQANKPKPRHRTHSLSRRSFVQLLPAVGLAPLAPHLETALAQGPQQQQAAQRVTKEMLQVAQQLIGIELNDAQQTMALQGVNRNLTTYEALRKIDIPLDVQPALEFHPTRPKKSSAAKTKFRFTPVELPKFNSTEDLAFCTVPQLGELVRTRRVSSVELTKMYLARLKRYGPKLICTVTLTEELALNQAEQADKEIRQGKYRGPLHGIPWGAKDLFATKGIPTTFGAEPYRDQMIDYDATVIERLRDVGAVLVAKLSLGALAQGSRWFAGNTRTPWNTEEGSSGSSAGPASATAAGLVGFSVGTETLGSIISPSSRCGVVGLRPTYGRISRYGAMILSWTMDKIGPICRGVEDCAAVLAALYGPDGRDHTVEDVPFNWNPDLPLAKMRIGYVKAEFEQAPNQANQANAAARKTMYDEALSALRSAGAKLEPVEFPRSPANMMIILSAEAASAFDDLTRSGGVNQLSGQGPGDWPNSFRTSRFIPAVEYLRAQRGRALLMRQLDEFMSKWDVIVTPAPGSASLSVTNLTGHPQVCVPCGFIENRPQAIMFTGGLYDEASPLRAALAFERATKWHTMHPKMDWA